MSTGSGALTKEDVLGHMDRLSNDPDFDPEFSQIIDFRQIASLEFGPDEVRQFAKRKIFSTRSRRAIVVKDDLQFGLARMFEIHRELKGETGIRVFRDYDEAVEYALGSDAVTRTTKKASS